VPSRNIYPVLGDRPLAEITRADGNEVLRTIAIARQNPTHARRVKAYLHKFGRWAEQDERVEESPFANLKTFGREQARDRILTTAEIRAVWHGCDRMGPFGRVVRFLLVAAQRRSEVADMEWHELDQERRVWLIPRERMKGDRAHLVPLSPLALSILAEQPKLGTHVFASTRSAPRGGTIPISGWSKFKARLDALAVEALRQLTGDPEATIRGWRLHDLRRTAASLMTECGVSRFIAGKVLGHAEQTVTGKHYDLYEYAAEKKQALDLWGARLAAIVEGREGLDNVVSLEAARGQR
jgi:integrase